MTEQNILSQAQAYCEATGVKLSTLGLWAFNNSRYFDRLERRADKMREDEQKLASYIAQNPPPATHAAE